MMACCTDPLCAEFALLHLAVDEDEAEKEEVRGGLGHELDARGPQQASQLQHTRRM